MTLKPLITKLFPSLTDDQLPSSGPGHGGLASVENGPPTIGTKPTRTPPLGAHYASASGLSSINENFTSEEILGMDLRGHKYVDKGSISTGESAEALPRLDAGKLV